MGQSGELTFYRSGELENPQSMLRELLQLANPQRRPLVWRTLIEDREWDRYVNDDFQEIPTESFFDKLAVSEIPDAYVQGTSLSVGWIGSTLGQTVGAAIESSIPEKVRGMFIPKTMGITIGLHDLWENAEHDEGFLFARAFLSIRFFGYGSPYDWPAFRTAVFEIPEVQAVKRELEMITGPLNECIYWSV